MTLTLDQYKLLRRRNLMGLTEAEIKDQYDIDMVLAALVVKCWLREIKTPPRDGGTIGRL